jgi:hypothetical protein
MSVHALVPALLGELRHPVSSFIDMLTGALLTFVDGARSDIDRVLQRHLFSTIDTSVPGNRPITANPSLSRLNLGVAVAADALMALVLTFACLRSLLERSFRARYSLKVMLPRLMLAIVLVQFSLPLMQMAVDLDNAMSQMALSLGDNINVDQLPWSPPLSHETVHHLAVTQDLFHAVFAVILVVAVIILVLAYVVRHALLGVLIVIAPLAGLCTTLPETRGYARTWMRIFLVAVFMQPVQLIVLRVATALAFDAESGLVQTLYALATLFLLLKVPGAMNTASHLETKAETLGHHVERSLRRAVHHGHHTTHTSHSSSSA